MNETVKIDLRISRKNVLLLNRVITKGLLAGNTDTEHGLLSSVPEENLSQLKIIAEDLLQKAGLIELSVKLEELSKCK